MYKRSYWCLSSLFQTLIIFLSNVGKYLCQTLDNIFVKRWITSLSNVGKYLCQTLKKPLPNVRLHPCQKLKSPLPNVELYFCQTMEIPCPNVVIKNIKLFYSWATFFILMESLWAARICLRHLVVDGWSNHRDSTTT